jgi:hypothetical protein
VVTMHIDDCTYTSNGKTYRRVLLRDSYRQDGKVKHTTIANLTKCSDQEIEAIKIALKNSEAIINADHHIKELHLQQDVSVGALSVLSQAAKTLGITKALGNSPESLLSLWLIIARVIDQGSRLSAVRLAERHAVGEILNLNSFNEDDLYRTLDWLHSNQESIELRLFLQKYPDTPPKLFLYDVSSTYLEGTENEMGAFGYNRDKKRGKLQIVFGLLTDEDGDPISIEAFKGNTQDPKTVHDQILKLANRFKCSEVTLVGDRGMIKTLQIEDLHDHLFHYITAITKPQIENLMAQGIIQLELFTEEVTEVTDKGVRYILRRNPQRAKEIRAIRQDKIETVAEFLHQKNRYPKLKLLLQREWLMN